MIPIVKKGCKIREGGTTGYDEVSCTAVGVVYVQDDVMWKEGVRGDGKLRDEMCGVVWGGCRCAVNKVDWRVCEASR